MDHRGANSASDKSMLGLFRGGGNEWSPKPDREDEPAVTNS